MKTVEVTGPNQFLAEAISYQLAMLLQIPVPAGAVGGVGDTLAWFSRAESAFKHYNPAHLPLTTNQTDFGRIVPLDVWVINEDRHPGNILLVGGEAAFHPVFIDFGNAMVGHPSDFAKRLDYVPREAQFAARTVALELLVSGATSGLAAIAALDQSDIRGVVSDACELIGFQTHAATIGDALLLRRDKLPELVSSFLARLGVSL